MRIPQVQFAAAKTLGELQTKFTIAINQLIDTLNLPNNAAIDAKGNRVTNVAAPSASGDAINLAYFQEKVNSINEETRRIALTRRSSTSSTSTTNVIWPISKKTSNYTVTSGDVTILGDCTSGNVTITLPASPEDGRVIIVKNLVALNTLTVAGNGNTIDGAVNLTTSTAGARFMLQYFAASTDWKIIT